MIRKIIIPTEKTYIIELPEEFIGKKVEVLAFELVTHQSEKVKLEQKSIEEITDFFDKHSVDMSDFKFNRDEANDYD